MKVLMTTIALSIGMTTAALAGCGSSVEFSAKQNLDLFQDDADLTFGVKLKIPLGLSGKCRKDKHNAQIEQVDYMMKMLKLCTVENLTAPAVVTKCKEEGFL